MLLTNESTEHGRRQHEPQPGKELHNVEDTGDAQHMLPAAGV